MPMTKEDKLNIIENIKILLKDANVIYLADIKGLNSVETTDLRRSCKNNNVSLKVVKNTLLKKAMEETIDKNFTSIYSVLKGNSALMISDVGNAPAKVINFFRNKNDKPILKAAWIEDNVYLGDESLPKLVALKSKDELISDIIFMLKSPINNIISQLENKN